MHNIKRRSTKIRLNYKKTILTKVGGKGGVIFFTGLRSWRHTPGVKYLACLGQV